MKEKGVFKNYIEYIEFPFYKNLIPHSKIEFDFPLTVLIGKNGGGKSSTLHALFGAPLGYTCSDFWFSTEVDPIAESGDRHRYFYGYKTDKDDVIKEVMKSRIKRGGTKTKKEDPDYWETSRPLKKDGMMGGIRYTPVEKDVVYLDFRNVYFLPNHKTPEEIVLSSKFVNKQYNDILESYDPINSLNAKKIMPEITKSDHGDCDHYDESANRLAYKWSLEESLDRDALVNVLTIIYNS